jgi:hypothetical protein
VFKAYQGIWRKKLLMKSSFPASGKQLSFPLSTNKLAPTEQIMIVSGIHMITIRSVGRDFAAPTTSATEKGGFEMSKTVSAMNLLVLCILILPYGCSSCMYVRIDEFARLDLQGQIKQYKQMNSCGLIQYPSGYLAEISKYGCDAVLEMMRIVDSGDQSFPADDAVYAIQLAYITETCPISVDLGVESFLLDLKEHGMNKLVRSRATKALHLICSKNED